MKLTLKRAIYSKALLVCAAILSAAMAASASERSGGLSHGKEGLKSHYMGMARLNLSPHIPIPLFSSAPSLSLPTSHGVYFPHIGIYTGGSAEIVYSVIGVAAVSSHTRYFYPSSHEGRTQGYVGAEAGIGIDYAMGGSVFFNGAVELGLVVNFQKVSLDIGLRGQFMPPYAIDCFFLPIRIGFVF